MARNRRHARLARRTPQPSTAYDEEEDGQEAVIPADLDERVKELCAAWPRPSGADTPSLR